MTKEFETKFGNLRHKVYRKVDSNIIYPIITSGDVWYFVIATIVFTFIGIISVLVYLGDN